MFDQDNNAGSFAAGLAIGRQWADTIVDDATRERFIDAAVIHGLPAPTSEVSAVDVASRLAASILGVTCDADAATAFWSMVAPGIRDADLSMGFFRGFIAGASEVFSDSLDDEYGELRKLARDPSLSN